MVLLESENCETISFESDLNLGKMG